MLLELAVGFASSTISRVYSGRYNGKDPAVSKAEVLNDADGELVSFFRVLQNHYLAFIDLYRHAVVSRQIFAWEQMKRPETLTDLQRAARFYYLQGCAYSRYSGNTSA